MVTTVGDSAIVAPEQMSLYRRIRRGIGGLDLSGSRAAEQRDMMRWLKERALESLAPMKSSHGCQRGRVGGSQRQLRKDRRRAHAAGKRNAFA